MFLVTDGDFNRSGKALGNKEYNDNEGAFTAALHDDVRATQAIRV